MNRRIAAVLVALSIVAGVGVGLLVGRPSTGDAEAQAPRSAPAPAPAPASLSPTPPRSSAATSSPAPTASATTGRAEDGTALQVANRADRAAAGLPSWSPADPEGRDGRPLEIGRIVPGGIEPVMAGTKVFEYMHQGYLVADQDPPCDGNHWLWAGQLSGGLHVAATQGGTVTALGADKDGPETPEGIGVGNSLRALKATYGAALSGVEPDDQGQGWVHVQSGDRWLAFALGPAGQATDRSRVEFIEAGRGRLLHHFGDAC